VAVYQFPEPNPKSGAKSVAVKKQWVVRYPSEPRDCESIVILGENAYLISKVTKNRAAEVFTFCLKDSAAPITLKPLAQLGVDSPVTAAAVSTDGKQLAAISKEGVFFFRLGGAFPGSGTMPVERHVRLRHASIEGCTFVPEGLLVTAESRELFLVKLTLH
jgi:hypothetical protein